MEQSKQNNSLIILLSILLFISLVIAGLFAFKTQKLVKELTVYRLQLTTTQTPTPTDPTASWKTYTNTKYNFSFKYPGEDLAVVSNRTVDKEHLETINFRSQDNNINIRIDEGPKSNLNLNESFEKTNFGFLSDDQVNITDTQRKTIGGRESLTKKVNVNNNSFIYTLIQLTNDRQISISVGYDSEDKYPEGKELLDQILSTFKFLDSTLTCKNDYFKISLLLPNNKWICTSKDDWIILKSDSFTITISSAGRGPYCGDGPDPENLCKTRLFKLSNLFSFYVYNYRDEDKEIFGGLGEFNNNSPWVSIIYKDMETKPMTSIQKQELLDLLNSIQSYK